VDGIIKMFVFGLRKIWLYNSESRDHWVMSQAAKIKSGAQVLDAGAGSCPYREHFSHCEYKTHDFTLLHPEQVAGKRGYGKIDYLSDVLSIPVVDSNFDVVLCTEVLEHVAEPILAVKEFARILKPGGKLLLTAPLGSGLHQQPYHYYGGYTPYWYRTHLSEAGFDDIRVEANGGFFKLYGQESVRFAMLLAPWRGMREFFLLPLWLLLLPWLFVACPLLCYFLDPLDRERDFTAGYFVTAVRGR